MDEAYLNIDFSIFVPDKEEEAEEGAKKGRVRGDVAAEGVV